MLAAFGLGVFTPIVANGFLKHRTIKHKKICRIAGMIPCFRAHLKFLRATTRLSIPIDRLDLACYCRQSVAGLIKFDGPSVLIFSLYLERGCKPPLVVPALPAPESSQPCGRCCKNKGHARA